MTVATGIRAGRGAFAWIAVAYGAALVAAIVVFKALPGQSEFVRGAVADLVATLVIFGFSFAFNNSSFYDAYWSVAPLPLLLGWWSPNADPRRVALVAVLVALWGARLTWNWARGWTGLQHEDWRYVQLRAQTGKLYWLASLFGLHLMPTVMVYLGSLGILAAVAGEARLEWLDGLAAVVTFTAIIIEATADQQLRRFVLSKPPREAVMQAGLWAYSRHPNYFGEVLFWWGICLFGVAAIGPYWWLFVGPVAINCLFLFVSIPLMEKRMLASRPAFAERQRRVSALVPWWPS